MEDKIREAVKTHYFQYGLKAENTEKVVNALKQRLSAAGTIAPEDLDKTIKAEIDLHRPFVAVMQSEIDSKDKKTPEPPTPPTSPTPPSPPSADEPEWAKALRLKMEKIEQDGEVQKKSQAKKTLIDEATKLAKLKGATNDRILNKAIKLASIDDGMTAEQVAGLVVTEYNDLQTTVSSDGAVPVIPTLGDKATVEAAQKKGVDLADKILGKPKE